MAAVTFETHWLRLSGAFREQAHSASRVIDRQFYERAAEHFEQRVRSCAKYTGDRKR